MYQMDKLQFQDPSKAMDKLKTETNMHATSDNVKHTQEQVREITLYFTITVFPVKSIHFHYKQYKYTDIWI